MNPRVIEVLSPLTEISIQDLTDQIKDWEDEPASLSYPKLVKTFGKQPLGGGVYVGITAELQNAKVSFQARTGTDDPPEVLCTISGGNLVAIDENGASMNPIYPTAYTQVVLAQSSSATIATPPSDYSLMYLIESLRGRQTSVGNIWYWDPSSGNDTNDGTTPSNAVQTFAKVQNLSAAAGAVNDIVFALATHSSGLTTVTNQTINITATTPGMKLRGPGYAFQLKPASAGSDVVTISADGVELSGFYIEPKSGGSDNGITVTSDNVLIKDCWVKSATANGIDISSTARTLIDTCAVENAAGYGISVGTGTSLSTIRKSIITGNAEGVYISGTAITDNILENNVIYNNTNSGINIAVATAVRTGIRLHHTFGSNAENITDNGTGTFQDTSGTVEPGDIDNIVSGVWNEVITTGYTTSGSAAKVLKDAKTRATLASLK